LAARQIIYSQGRDFVSRHHVYTGYGSHPASYPTRTGKLERSKREADKLQITSVHVNNTGL